MANKRMCLLHEASGKTFVISKRFATAWQSDGVDGINEFFEDCFGDGDFVHQDDFKLIFED